MICAEIEDVGHDVPNGVWMVMINDTGSVDRAGIAYYSVAEPEPGNDLCTRSVTSDATLVQDTVDTCNLRGVKSADRVDSRSRCESGPVTGRKGGDTVWIATRFRGRVEPMLR
jgi:hypothetical protein